MPSPHFTPGLFRFLSDLRRHNDRTWFQANRERYEAEVRLPLLRFIGDFAGPLRKNSRSFEADARPVGGSMFRIYRDTRFSKDKTPYKTHAAAHFRHRASRDDVHAPGFYLHLEPGRNFAAAGLWRPEADALKRVRNAIVGQPRRWRAVTKGGLKVEGESLKRPPRGYEPEHVFIEDLKRKDFVASVRFPDADVTSPSFLKKYAEPCRTMSPLVAFLTRTLELPF